MINFEEEKWQMLWLSCHTLYCHHCQHCHKKYRRHNEEHKMLPFFLSLAWPRRSSWRWPTPWPGNTLMTTTITITQLCTWEGGELCNCKDKPLSIEGGGIHIFDKYLLDKTFVTFPLSRIYQRESNSVYRNKHRWNIILEYFFTVGNSYDLHAP